MEAYKAKCRARAIGLRAKAKRHGDDLTSGLSRSETMVEEATRVRARVAVMRAKNEADSEKLRELAHSCVACKLETPDKAPATDSVETLINDAKAKLDKMQALAAEINARKSLANKLEKYHETYSNISKSLNIVVEPDTNAIDYSYKIDPKNGVGLFIHNRDTKKDQARPDMMEALRPMWTPVLAPGRSGYGIPFDSMSIPKPEAKKPTDAPSPTEAIGPLPFPSWMSEAPFYPPPPDRKNVVNPNIGVRKLNEKAKPMPWPQVIPPPPSPFKYSRPWAGRLPPSDAYVGGLLSSQYGVQYNPYLQSVGTEHQSHMVIFSGLDPGTTWADVLDKVRGGPVLRVSRADVNTVFVSFVKGADAYAYVTYVDSRPPNSPLKIRGRVPRVSLAPTPSYPIRDTLLYDVEKRGVTRCLGFQSKHTALRPLIEEFLNKRGMTCYKLTQKLEPESAVVDGGDADYEKIQGPASEFAEEWVILDDGDEPADAAKKPEKANMVSIHIAFRDVAHAQNAHHLLSIKFPDCLLCYEPDSCAAPLAELDELDKPEEGEVADTEALI
ncbi:hypothetical protein F5X98DRAFT_386748 [Xylaria grammica]|nr:hypothetical protein F5X98DRAFT_386748 [Xylaria grammica]